MRDSCAGRWTSSRTRPSPRKVMTQTQTQHRPPSAASPISVSRSELADAERCPRRWLFFWYWGYVPADPAPTGLRNLGGRVHTALEGWYGYGLDPLMIINLLYAAAVEEHPD